MNLYFFVLMQRYGEKPPIPNNPSDFFLTIRDTPLFLRQNPHMPLISVANTLKNIHQSLVIWIKGCTFAAENCIKSGLYSPPTSLLYYIIVGNGGKRMRVSFLCVIAGYNPEELTPKYPDFIKERVMALYDSVYWWYEYGT